MEQLLGRNYSFNLFNFIDRFQTRIVQAIFMVEKKMQNTTAIIIIQLQFPDNDFVSSF